VKIGVLYDRLNPCVTEALARLSSSGVEVELFAPGAAVPTPRAAEPDLYYLKTSAPPQLAAAAALHAAGASTINPYPRLAALASKAVAVAALARARLPSPRTWLASDAQEFAPLLRDGPLVVKPNRGSRGRGVRVVRDRRDLAAPPGDALLAQRFHPSDDGMDHKIYCIGDRVFGVRRTFPCGGWEEKLRTSRPFEPDARLREIALRAGRALGLSLFGLDVVVSGGEPYVVDVNPCAGFLGVPGAAALLSDHLAYAAAAAAAAASARG
jgi:glutathione synthase/RimK-type ligase-like ATP-grasp enzyme